MSPLLKSSDRYPWPYNPLVTLIRLHGSEIISDIVKQYETAHHFRASNFDVMIQVMLTACSYDPSDVWLTQGQDIIIASEFIEKNAPEIAFDILENAIEKKRVRLNRKLIRTLARQQIKRLHKIHATSKNKVELPTQSDAVLSGFLAGSELIAFNLPSRIKNKTYEAAAVEKLSKEKVVFRPISLALSRIYIEAFHYLHLVRDDDIAAFGAFKEKETMPFAIVTYAPVARSYKQKILQAAGIDAKRSLELTRGWNSEGSPKNTMSLLYAYAHTYIHEFGAGKNALKPQAILTAVNPNLGFKGSAFRAVGFGVIGEKPTSYHYIVDRSGKRTFTLRRNLASLLEKTGETQFTTARFPLLSTKELAVLLQGKKRLKPISDVLYNVNEAEYDHEFSTY